MGYFDTIHVNQPLTNVSVRYNWAEGIADKVFPEAPVKKETDLYYVYSRDHLRLEETIRANGAEAKVTGRDHSTATYTLEEHALKEIITQRDRDNADTPLSLDMDTTMGLTESILIRREVDCANLCFTTASWSNNVSVASANAWDTNTSNPIADVLTGTASCLRNGFIRPNSAVMGWEVFRILKVNSITMDSIKYTQRGIITEDILASLFDIDNLYVGRAARVTSAEGTAETTGFIWGKDMLVYYKPQSPRLKTPSAGYMLTIGGRFRTKKWRDEARGGDWIEVSSMFVPKTVATSAAFLIKQAVI